MFPVNVTLRHQRPERAGNKKKWAEFESKWAQKRKFTVWHTETKRFEWSVGAKVLFFFFIQSRKKEVKWTLNCVLVCFQGSPGPSGAVGPIGPAGVRVSKHRLLLMATMLSEFFTHEQNQCSFSLWILYFQGPQGKDGPAGPRGPVGPMVRALMEFFFWTPGSCCLHVNTAEAMKYLNALLKDKVRQFSGSRKHDAAVFSATWIFWSQRGCQNSWLSRFTDGFVNWAILVRGTFPE